MNSYSGNSKKWWGGGGKRGEWSGCWRELGILSVKGILVVDFFSWSLVLFTGPPLKHFIRILVSVHCILVLITSIRASFIISVFMICLLLIVTRHRWPHHPQAHPNQHHHHHHNDNNFPGRHRCDCRPHHQNHHSHHFLHHQVLHQHDHHNVSPSHPSTYHRCCYIIFIYVCCLKHASSGLLSDMLCGSIIVPLSASLASSLSPAYLHLLHVSLSFHCESEMSESSLPITLHHHFSRTFCRRFPQSQRNNSFYVISSQREKM